MIKEFDLGRKGLLETLLEVKETRTPESKAIIGIGLFSFGTIISLLSLGFFGNEIKREGVTLILATAGTTVALCGLELTSSVLARRRRVERRKKLMMKHAVSPWLWDHQWNPKGFVEDRKLWSSLWGVIRFIIAAIPLHWINWYEQSYLGYLLLGLGDLAFLLFAGDSFYRLLQSLKFGRTLLCFPTFPIFPGTEAKFILKGFPANVGMKRLKITLYCVRRDSETIEELEHLDNSFIVLHKDMKVIDVRGKRTAQEFTFEIPDLPELSTDISGSPPRFWAVEVSSELDGIDYCSEFLIPVYARPNKNPA